MWCRRLLKFILIIPVTPTYTSRISKATWIADSQPGPGLGWYEVSEWAKELTGWLRQRGFSFEAEGEAIRVHLDNGIIVEVVESRKGRGYDVVVTVPLPGNSDEALDEASQKAIVDAYKILGGLSVDEIRYEVDDSMPEYPSLRVYAVGFSDPTYMAKKLVETLSEFAPSNNSD